MRKRELIPLFLLTLSCFQALIWKWLKIEMVVGLKQCRLSTQIESMPVTAGNRRFYLSNIRL